VSPAWVEEVVSRAIEASPVHEKLLGIGRDFVQQRVRGLRNYLMEQPIGGHLESSQIRSINPHMIGADDTIDGEFTPKDIIRFDLGLAEADRMRKGWDGDDFTQAAIAIYAERIALRKKRGWWSKNPLPSDFYGKTMKTQIVFLAQSESRAWLGDLFAGQFDEVTAYGLSQIHSQYNSSGLADYPAAYGVATMFTADPFDKEPLSQYLTSAQRKVGRMMRISAQAAYILMFVKKR